MYEARFSHLDTSVYGVNNPSPALQSGEWGEVTSSANCTAYRAGGMNCRDKTKGEKGTKFVHTLNGTAIACSRALIAILENNQQADGSITIPEVLQPMMGKDRIG